MNILDKLIGYISPRNGINRLKDRKIYNLAKIEQGYSNKDDPVLENWRVSPNSPDEDILYSLDDLRAKSRNLYMNNDLAGAALKKMRTKTVGSGLLPKPTINYTYLGIDREKAKELERIIKNKFNAWALSPNSDASRMFSFYGLQSLLQLSWVMNGDAFAIPLRKKRKGVDIELCVQLLEADRVISPPGANLQTRAGVEFDENGELKNYYIATSHPADTFNYTVKAYPAFNSLGRKNILHIFEPERIGQRRGVPILGPIIFSLKQLGRYKSSELTAAVINAMIGLIVESENADDEGFAGNFGTPMDEDDEKTIETKKRKEEKITLDHGTLVVGKPGEKIKEFATNRPNKHFKDFVEAICEEIGANLEISKEVLMSSFKNSYSAAKASIEEAYQRFQVSRKILERTFCQPIYEEFVLELIRNGEIDCPGFFEDTSIRYAFTRCIWVGAGKSSLDPLKDANANSKELENYTTSRSIISATSGYDYEEIFRERAEEEKELALLERELKTIRKGVKENGKNS